MSTLNLNILSKNMSYKLLTDAISTSLKVFLEIDIEHWSLLKIVLLFVLSPNLRNGRYQRPSNKGLFILFSILKIKQFSDG